MTQFCEKCTPELLNKQCLKACPEKSKMIEKVTPKSILKSDGILKRRLLRHLWWPSPLLDIRSVPPALPKFPMIEKGTIN